MDLARRAFLRWAGIAAGARWAGWPRTTLSAHAAAAAGPTNHTEVAPDLYILSGAVNTGVLVRDGKGLLFDACDSVTPERLRAIGVEVVEMICCTQHRRPNVAGAARFIDAGARLVVPASERPLFEDVAAYWKDPKNRWHLYHNQPGPQVVATPLPVAQAVREGDTVEWRGVRIRVLDTPGATDGSVSYLVETASGIIAFCGDLLCGPGQVWDLHSLQKGLGELRDYHGFLGNREKLLPSLRKAASCGAQRLVPSHGAPIADPQAAIQLLETRLDQLWRNYTAISALNFYFPTLFDDTKDDPKRMAPAPTLEPPAWIRRVAYTSFALISDSGAALLIDCGHDAVVDTLQQWIADKAITAVEGCWVTHYHDDHVDALPRVAKELRCPIMTDRRVSEIIEHPECFFLPCISPNAAPVAKATEHGESWTWQEFTLTAFHFPGQTFYHAGLLVEGHGERAFFAGDSGAPTGLDDYCCGNRVFLGAAKGSRFCLDIWRQYAPDYILNEHQDRAFRFTAEQLDSMDKMLEERERLIAEMTPWPHANFATDEWWIRTYPYEQEAAPGGSIAIDVEFTNHGPQEAEAVVVPVLPEGWGCAAQSVRITVPPDTSGSRDAALPRPDRAARIALTVAPDVVPGLYVIPFRITWDGRYLGQFRHAVVVTGHTHAKSREPGHWRGRVRMADNLAVLPAEVAAAFRGERL